MSNGKNAPIAIIMTALEIALYNANLTCNFNLNPFLQKTKIEKLEVSI